MSASTLDRIELGENYWGGEQLLRILRWLDAVAGEQS